MREINKVVLHHSASDHSGHDSINVIRRWHQEDRHWFDIGYNFVITKAHHGKIHIGRPIHKVPAGEKGHNAHAIHICLTGLHKFSDEQINSTVDLVVMLLSIFELTVDNVYGHRELRGASTECPNFDMDLIRRLICLKANSIGKNCLGSSPGK